MQHLQAGADGESWTWAGQGGPWKAAGALRDTGVLNFLLPVLQEVSE